MEKQSVWLLLCLTCSLPACCWAFTCFEGTVCRGDSIPGLARKGDCCAGKGLSFSDERQQCFDCFSEAAFSGEGSEFFLAFFNNLFPGSFFSRANLRLSVGAMGVGVGQDGIQFMVESREDQDMERTGAGGTPTEVGLDISLRLVDVSDRDEGICVRSLDGRGLSIVALSEEFTSVGTFKVLPCVFLPNQGYEYFVVSVQRPPADPDVPPREERSAFAIIPSEDETLINLNLTRRVDISDAPDLVRQIGSEAIEIGQPVTITLNRRQSLYISSLSDLSGSRVVTNKPVAFITGHECGNIPRNFTFCDQMVEQIPPTATWGYEFLTASISNRTGRDVFKAVSSLNSGSFSGRCFLPLGESERDISFEFERAGQPVEFQVSSNGYCYFESTVPTLLLQFSTGTGVDNVLNADPFMVMVPPIQQYQNSFLLSTFLSQAVQGINYLNIFVPTMGEVDRNEVILDGSPVTQQLRGGWVDIRCLDRERTCGYAVQLEVSARPHVLNHTDPSARFSVIAYWLAFRAGHGYVGGLTQRPITLPQVTFITAAVNVFENESAIGIDLLRSGRDFGQSVEVFIKSRDDTAIAGEDYIAFNTSIVFGPEERLKTIQVQLAPDDVFPEGSKSFDIFLTASPGVYLSPTTVINVTILNDDLALPEVNISFAETRLTVREGVGIVQIRLLKADDTSVPGGRGVVRVRLTTEDGSAIGAPFGQGDYQPLVEDVAFDVSDTEQIVTTTIINNYVLENVESFTATIVALEGLFPVAVVMNGTVTVEIVDDDVVVVGFSQTLFTVSEAQQTVNVSVELLFGTTDVGFGVIVSTVNDFDAVAGEDFEAINTTLSFGSDFEDTQIVTITILGDDQIESSEIISLQLWISEEVSSGSIQLIPDVAQVVIQDNDRLVIGLDRPAEVRVEEGKSVNVTVRVLEGSLEEDAELLVGLSAISGTARAGVDFEGMINRRLKFIGDTSSLMVRIRTIEDEAFEEQETFFVLITLLSGPGMAEVDSRHSKITVMIDDDDPQITVMTVIKLISASYQVPENNGSVFVCVMKSSGAEVEERLSVNLTSIPRDAEGSLQPNSGDFQLVKRTIIFTGDQDVACVSIPITNDSTHEPPEDFIVDLETPHNVEKGEPSMATVTIIDDDDSDQGFFQIQIGPVDHCVTWTPEKIKAVEDDIQIALAEVVINECKCKFALSNILVGQFSCRTTLTQVIYRSTILGTAGYNASYLLDILEAWVASGPTITTRQLLLDVYSSCPVRISSLSDPECPVSNSQPLGDPTLITSDPQVIQCVHVCLLRTQGRGICGV